MQKITKLILTNIAIALLVVMLCVCAFAANGVSQFSVSVNGAAAGENGTVNWLLGSDGNYYLMLPNGTDASNLTVYYNADDAVTIDGQQVANGAATNAFADGSATIVCAGKTYNVIAKSGDGISTIYIKTETGSLAAIHADKSHKEPGDILVVDTNGEVEYDGVLDYMKGRGNSTWQQAKKPYNIKLDKKADLFGLGKSKKFSLLANADDSSMVRTSFGFDLFDAMGIAFVSKSEMVNLYVNGSYEGVYQLIERVEIDDNRVEIFDLEGATEDVNELELDEYVLRGAQGVMTRGTYKYADIPNNPENITGGYLLELEKIYRYPDEASGFITKRGQAVVVKAPEYATKEQVEYISAYWQEFEDALYSPTGTNSLGKHYTDYIDLHSLALMYVAEELSINYDGCSSSFYLYKDLDSKLTAGPTWDFGLAFGNGFENRLINNVDTTNDTSYHYIQSCYVDNSNKGTKAFLAQAFNHADFRAEVSKVWTENVLPNVPSIEPNINSYAQALSNSIIMNGIRWNILGGPNADSIRNSHNGIINWVKTFTAQRIAFLTNSYALDTFVVMYDGGEYATAVTNDNKTYKAGDTATVLPAVKAPAGTYMLFKGWSTEPNGQGTVYKPGDTIEISGDVQLYANWQPDTSLRAMILRLYDAIVAMFNRLQEFFSGLFR